MKAKTILKLCTLSAAFCTMSILANAQGNPGDPGIDPDPNPPGTSVPIDLGLGICIAAGLGYAAKKRMDKKTTGQPNETL